MTTYISEEMVKAFVKWRDWFIRVNDPTLLEMWHNQPTYLLANILYIAMAVISLKFALKHGWNSRYTYMWFAALLHGVVTEIVCYQLPDINNFWHSQTSMIFAGQRFPLYIVLFYPATITYAYIAVDKLNLPALVEPFAVGLFDVLLDFPYDIMGIKLLWWTWHDTDPNIGDRHYWVPWTSYFFHMGFHSTFTALLNGSRYLLTGNCDKEYASGGFIRESFCVVITALFSMAFAVVFQFLPIYHGLKDGFGIHSEVIMCFLFTLYTGIVYWYDRNPKGEVHGNTKKKTTITDWCSNDISAIITIYYLFYALLVLFVKPENERSFGMHEPIGPASEKMQQYAISGVVYTKQKYLDPQQYDEGYFDFRCTNLAGYIGTPNMSAHPELKGVQWYTICGTPFENHAEYILVVWTFCAIGFFAFYNALARSANLSTKNRVGTRQPAYGKPKGKRE